VRLRQSVQKIILKYVWICQSYLKKTVNCFSEHDELGSIISFAAAQTPSNAVKKTKQEEIKYFFFFISRISHICNFLPFSPDAVPFLLLLCVININYWLWNCYVLYVNWRCRKIRQLLIMYQSLRSWYPRHLDTLTVQCRSLVVHRLHQPPVTVVGCTRWSTLCSTSVKTPVCFPLQLSVTKRKDRRNIQLPHSYILVCRKNVFFLSENFRPQIQNLKCKI